MRYLPWPSRCARALLAAGIVVACNGDSSGPQTASSLAITPSDSTLLVGDTLQLQVTIRDAQGTQISSASPTWTSLDPAATVDASGRVEGVAKGSARIIAALGTVADTAIIAVVGPGITLEPEQATVAVDDTVQLTATVRDSQGAIITDRILTVTSSDYFVAGITVPTRVVGILPGTATITVSSNGDTATAKVVVTNPRPPTGRPLIAYSAKVPTQGSNFEIFLINPDASGSARLTAVDGDDFDPDWSPDGEKIVFTSTRDNDSEIYVMDADGTNQTRLTASPLTDEDPAWSPDGSRIAFSSVRDGNREIYVMNADGTGVTRLTNDPGTDLEPAWIPDGTRIIFVSDRAGGSPARYQIYSMAPDGSALLRLTNSNGNDMSPAYSPEGERIAFASDRDGQFEIYVMDQAGGAVTRFTISDPASFQGSPAWSPDGGNIAFERNGHLWTMDDSARNLQEILTGKDISLEPTWRR
jgi:WD40 repeat protein